MGCESRICCVICGRIEAHDKEPKCVRCCPSPEATDEDVQAVREALDDCHYMGVRERALSCLSRIEARLREMPEKKNQHPIWHEDYQKMLRDHLAQPAATRLMPVEPTREMEHAGLVAFINHIETYRESDERLLEKYKDDPMAVHGLKHMRMGAEMRNGKEMSVIYKAMREAWLAQQAKGE